MNHIRQSIYFNNKSYTIITIIDMYKKYTSSESFYIDDNPLESFEMHMVS